MALIAAKSWTWKVEQSSYNMGSAYGTLYLQQYQDVENNSSYIYITGAKFYHDTFHGSYDMTAKIVADGVTLASFSDYSAELNSTSDTEGVEVSGTFPVYKDSISHNSDGSKTVTLTLTMEMSSSSWHVGSSTFTQTIELDNIHTHIYTTIVTPPTCTEQGYTTYICECGDSYISDYTDALGHNWDDGVVTIIPTYEVEGIKTYTCTRCGETMTESIAKLIATVYIDNGESLDGYSIYIDNGEEWEAYILYIDDGENFVAYC